jgi:pimeloyl-ACP methyl ester carboxylesterase
MKQILVSFLFIYFTMPGVPQSFIKSETVSLHGSKIYYEVFGKGRPLVLLHGFTHSSKEWYPFVEKYAEEFTVYLIDLRGHGNSSWFTETLSIRKVAEDVEALMYYLKLDSIYSIGYSFGGDVLFQLTLLNPGLVKKMIVIGSCGIADLGQSPEYIEYFSFKNIANLPWMLEEHTGEDQIKSILEQIPNYSVQLTNTELKSITTKTLLVIGDKEDSILWEDLLRTKTNLSDSYLWILPNSSHRVHKENKKEFIRVSLNFLNHTDFKL